MQITPYQKSDRSKKEQVRHMFDRIAPRYDLLNHLLSLGIDRRWRKALVRAVAKQQPATILDVATGTGDLAIALRTRTGAAVTGVDLSPEMLRLGVEKCLKLGLEIPMIEGDAEALPFPDGSFEAVTAAFGVRNFENLTAGLSDMHRVLTVGGGLYILEFSMPRSRFVAWFYRLYFLHILPVIGGVISRERKAYSYLPKSVEGSLYGKAFTDKLTQVGFTNVTLCELMGGIATLYTANK